jgi:hypothetical protein
MQSSASNEATTSQSGGKEAPWEIGADGKLALTPAQSARLQRQNEEFRRRIGEALKTANFANRETP